MPMGYSQARQCSVLTGDGVWLCFTRWQVFHRGVAPLGTHATSSGPHGSGPSPLVNLIWDHLQIFQGSLILSLRQGQFGLQVIHCFLQLLTREMGIRWTFKQGLDGLQTRHSTQFPVMYPGALALHSQAQTRAGIMGMGVFRIQKHPGTSSGTCGGDNSKGARSWDCLRSVVMAHG